MKPKTITQILEGWLENANSTSMMGVTIDDERTDTDREKQYQDYLAEAKAQIQQLLEECAPEKSPPIKPEDVDMGLGEGIHAKIAISAYRNGYNQAIDQYKSNIREKLK